MIRGLDDDEVDFLEIVDKAKMVAEQKQQIEENNELLEFRQRVASLQEKSMDDVSRIGVLHASIFIYVFSGKLKIFVVAENQCRNS